MSPTQEAATRMALEALEGKRFTACGWRTDCDVAITALKAALSEPVQAPQCNPHPKAPHGFLRNASHNEDRYVCECEGWDPYEAGRQAGMEAALEEPVQDTDCHAQGICQRGGYSIK